MSGEKEEWGPWIEHDGLSIPKGIAIGVYVDVFHHVYRWGNILHEEGVIRDLSAWTNICEIYGPAVIRYRIRKPKGLTILTDILREVERDGDKVYGDRELEEV